MEQQVIDLPLPPAVKESPQPVPPHGAPPTMTPIPRPIPPSANHQKSTLTPPAQPRPTRAPLWLALHFPHLPLEVVTRGAPVTGPFAVIEGQGTQCCVLSRNRAAAATGVKPGQHLSAAQSLAPLLNTAMRQEAAEAAALERLAAWAYQFSSRVAIVAPNGLLLEISGSLRLFKGLENLVCALQRDLTNLGYRTRRSIAPTPLGAWLLARSGDRRPALKLDDLRRQLGALPLQMLELPADTLSALRELGLLRVRDCLRLPRDGLNRRLGTAVLDYLDRALGRKPDLRPPFEAREGFTNRLALPAEVHTTEGLHFALHRLLLELVGVLRARDGVIQQFTLKLHHLKRPPTELTLGLLVPGRDLVHLQQLVDNRLERLELPAPVLELSLEANGIMPFRGERHDFFVHTTGDQLNAGQLIDRLRTRLGEQAVRMLSPVADHRPEHAWRSAGSTVINTSHPGVRPLWLLEKPQLLPGADRWQLQAGPERVESGWWDGQDLARDYFVAERKGARLWLFRELRGSLRWFLHGVFG